MNPQNTPHDTSGATTDANLANHAAESAISPVIGPALRREQKIRSAVGQELYHLAIELETGSGGLSDDMVANKILHRAAFLGSDAAANLLAQRLHCRRYTRHCPVSDELIAELANRGNAECQYAIGHDLLLLLWIEPASVAQEAVLKRGLDLLESAANQGHIQAKTDLGQWLLTSPAAVIDEPRACRHLADAAELGSVEAATSLGFHLRAHARDQADLERAERYLRMAARGGSRNAQAELAMSRVAGKTVPK